MSLEAAINPAESTIVPPPLWEDPDDGSDEESDEQGEECVDCHCAISIGDDYRFDGDPYCQDCTGCCEDCHAIEPVAALDGGLCEQCLSHYASCYDCGDRTHDDALTTVDGEYVCDSCIDHYTYCTSCDRYELDSDRCVGSSGLIEDYSYKPYPDFYLAEGELDDPARPFFGVELETEAVDGDIDEGAELVSSGLGELAYLKQDGSLDHGFEIVTHPMTLRFAQQQDWGALRALATIGFRAWQTETCGIHVHVSRSGFKGSAHIWRFAHLLYRNATECQRFAGRAASSWASFEGQRTEVAKVLKHEMPPARYVAVNLCNAKTIEVRMFRASLKADRLLADIEFVAAGIEYARRLTVPEVKADALSWWAFRSYLDDNTVTYPHLVAILAKGGN